MKKIILILLLLLLCGCTLDYTANIMIDDTIDETVIFKEPESLNNNEKFFDFKNNYNNLIEKFNTFKTNSMYIGETEQIIATDNIKNTNRLFDKYKVFIEDYLYTGIINKKLKFKIKKEIFDKYKIDNFTLNLNIPYKVIESNENIHKGNYYTWNLDKTNREIKIKFNTLSNNVNFNNNTNTLKKIGIITIIVILLSVIFVPLFVLIKKKGD